MSRRFRLLKPAIWGFLCVGIFLSGLHPINAYDTFFGLKIGEYVIKNGQIPSQEIYSWAAYGREWIAYEWLAQTWVYLLNTLGGFKAIEVYVTLALTGFFLLSFSMFNTILQKGYIVSLFLSLFLTSSIYEFIVSRPQTIAFSSFLAIIYFIFKKILLNKNQLIWTLPITYVWTNSHGSFIFIPFLFFSYAILSFFYFKFNHDLIKAKEQFKTLFKFACLNTLITFLPPLWYKPYQLLWQFASDIQFLTNFLSEWNVLSKDETYQALYTLLVVISLITSAVLSIKQRILSKWLLALPILAITMASFQAIRHVSFGTISILVILGLFSQDLNFKKRSHLIIIPFMLIVLLFSFWLVTIKRQTMFDANWKFPHQAVHFLKQYELEGRMFNEFSTGGYFLYYLYPKYQVFFDGRADIYRCCELRDFWPLIKDKRASRETFKDRFETFFAKYQFSFFLAPPESYNPLEFTSFMLIGDTLLDDPNWRLIYFDDQMEIFLRNDGKNDELYQNLGMSSTTPFRLNPYRKDRDQPAKEEYLRMIRLQDSGIARNGLGQIYLKNEQLPEAQREFEKGSELNPKIGTPYVGLGKIALKENRTDEAIRSFQKAIEIAPYLGEAYLLLGRTYVEHGEKEKAQTVLEQGLKQNIDFISRRDIVKELKSLLTDSL